VEVESHEERRLRREGLEVGLVAESVGGGGDGWGEVGLRGGREEEGGGELGCSLVSSRISRR